MILPPLVFPGSANVLVLLAIWQCLVFTRFQNSFWLCFFNNDVLCQLHGLRKWIKVGPVVQNFLTNKLDSFVMPDTFSLVHQVYQGYFQRAPCKCSRLLFIFGGELSLLSNKLV